MARLDVEGRLDATISAGRRTLHGDPRWVRLFEDAGVPSVHEPRMALWLRCHAPMCIAMESIGGGEAARSRGLVARSGDRRAGSKGGLRNRKGLGYRPYPSSKAIIGAAPRPLLATMLWAISRVSAFAELLATGENECRALVTAMIAAASAADPPLSEAVAALAAVSPRQAAVNT